MTNWRLQAGAVAVLPDDGGLVMTVPTPLKGARRDNRDSRDRRATIVQGTENHRL